MNSPLNWKEARQYCLTAGGDLASILSLEEQLQINIMTGSHGRYAIGLNDRGAEDTFVWSDGNAVNFTNWHNGEPNDAGGEDCTAVVYGFLGGKMWYGHWNDYPCLMKLKAICKIPLGK